MATHPRYCCWSRRSAAYLPGIRRRIHSDAYPLASDEAVISTINLLTSTELSVQCFASLRASIGEGWRGLTLLTPLDGGQFSWSVPRIASSVYAGSLTDI